MRKSWVVLLFLAVALIFPCSEVLASQIDGIWEIKAANISGSYAGTTLTGTFVQGSAVPPAFPVRMIQNGGRLDFYPNPPVSNPPFGAAWQAVKFRWVGSITTFWGDDETGFLTYWEDVVPATLAGAVARYTGTSTDTVPETGITWNRKVNIALWANDTLTIEEEHSGGGYLVKQKFTLERVRSFTVTVNSGPSASGSGSYAPGATVYIGAGGPPSGKQFKEWITASAGVTFANATSPNTSFTMPSNDVVVMAIFEDLPSSNHYPIIVTFVGQGTANADVLSAEENDVVTLTAMPNAGWRIKEWEVTSGGVTLSTTTASPATFTMPDNSVVVKAIFEVIPTFAVTVIGGTGSGFYAAGATVEIEAIVPPEHTFVNWTASQAVTFTGGTNATSPTAEFTMLDRPVTVTAKVKIITNAVDPTALDNPATLAAVELATGIDATELEEFLEVVGGKVVVKGGVAEAIAKSKGVTPANVVTLAVFEATVANGAMAAVEIPVTGAELGAASPDKIVLLKIFSSGSGERLTYMASGFNFDNNDDGGKFTLLAANGAVYTGAIVGTTNYILLVFIRDGGRYDLDEDVNGVVVDPLAIVHQQLGAGETNNKGGGGCDVMAANAVGFALALLALAGLVARRKK